MQDISKLRRHNESSAKKKVQKAHSIKSLQKEYGELTAHLKTLEQNSIFNFFLITRLSFHVLMIINNSYENKGLDLLEIKISFSLSLFLEIAIL